jgi:hypothetical protein
MLGELEVTNVIQAMAESLRRHGAFPRLIEQERHTP